MQCAFMGVFALEVPPAWDIVPNIRKLIDCCLETDIPVVFTE